MQENSKNMYFAKKTTRSLRQLCLASYTMNVKQNRQWVRHMHQRCVSICW